MLMNKDKRVRKHTSRCETRGYVYFILLYGVTIPLKQLFKMAAFGLYTQSGSFSVPSETGVPHHLGSNSDVALVCVLVRVSFLKELQILFQKSVCKCHRPAPACIRH
jgi:hypothetical protein